MGTQGIDGAVSFAPPLAAKPNKITLFNTPARLFVVTVLVHGHVFATVFRLAFIVSVALLPAAFW